MVGESGRSQIARLTRFHANNANPKELDSLLDWILRSLSARKTAMVYTTDWSPQR